MTRRSVSETGSGGNSAVSPRGKKPKLPKHLAKDMHVKHESGLEKAPFLMQFKG